VDAALVNAAHEHCLAVHPYTIDDAAEMERLDSIGVDGIFTNLPDRLLAMRPADEPRGREALQLAADTYSRCRGRAAQGI
jgi:hypothetical protein